MALTTLIVRVKGLLSGTINKVASLHRWSTNRLLRAFPVPVELVNEEEVEMELGILDVEDDKEEEEEWDREGGDMGTSAVSSSISSTTSSTSSCSKLSIDASIRREGGDIVVLVLIEQLSIEGVEIALAGF